MKTSRGLWGAALLGTLLVLQGCGGAGTYQIPNVEPVVKPKPEDDLLDDIEGNDKPSESAEKPAEAKPVESSKPAETPKAEPAKAPDPPKAAPATKTTKAAATSKK